ncbi:MAG: hypothetical protein HQL53_03245 [Magnetococcales bacterium]|nr:hypothetical protein [Magnetococcales bacterium]
MGGVPGALWAWSGPPVPFSATVVRTDPTQPEKSAKGRIYVDRLGVRTEGRIKEQPVVMIFHPDAKQAWMLFPDQKRMIQHQGVSAARPPLPDEDGSPCKEPNRGVQCRKVGRSVVSGRSVVMWEVGRRNPNNGKMQYSRLWVDPRLKVAVREEYANGSSMHMLNIQEGRQSDELFRVPRNYEVTRPAAPVAPRRMGR